MPKRPESGHVMWIGADPGASGGLACIIPPRPDCDEGWVVDITKMPETERDMWSWVNDTDLDGDIHRPTVRFAVVEKNSGYVGGDGNPGASMFKFGRITGLVEMALIAAGIPYELVTPAVWQKALGVPTRKRGESKPDHKRKLKAHAQRLFPSLDGEITLATCDALLIAEFCRRKREGKL